MAIRVVGAGEIAGLRDRYRAEMNAQIVHDAWHRRGFTTVHRFEDGGTILGYGAVGGRSGRHSTVKEFYLLPEFRERNEALFAAFVSAAGPGWIEAQTNDPFLAPLLARHGTNPVPAANLFADGAATMLPNPGVLLRPVVQADDANVFPHSTEPVGNWGLEREGELVATGGLLFHYNPPFGDIYMEVAPGHRGRGYASYLVQELRRIAREGGHRPAARCDIENAPSKRALERGGMHQCGQLVRAALRAEP